MPPKIRCSGAQKRILAEYMAQHPNFANGEYNGPLGSTNYEAQWEALALLLREHGPDKSVHAWKTSWRDLKRNARKTNAAANRAKAATGNRVDIPIVGEEHELVLAAIGRESSEGVGPGESRIGNEILQDLRRANDLKEQELNLMREQNLLGNRNGIAENLDVTEIIEEEVAFE